MKPVLYCGPFEAVYVPDIRRTVPRAVAVEVPPECADALLRQSTWTEPPVLGPPSPTRSRRRSRKEKQA